MKSMHSLAAIAAAALLLASSLPALAGDGHDHGDAAPAATGPALPRFAAVSETFELVGVLKGKQITLYLDRFGDNAPVRGATIELEIGGAKFTAAKDDDDLYTVVLKEAPKPGVLPVTATVTAGSDLDLLAGELDLHEDAHSDEAAPARAWTAYAGWGAAALALLAVSAALVFGVRRVMAGRPASAGGVA